jgi:hypothetical protein
MAKSWGLTACTVLGASSLLANSSPPRDVGVEVFFHEHEGEKKKEVPESNPTARGCPHQNNVYVTADFIYWKAIEDDVVVAAKSPNFLSGKGNLGLTQYPTTHFAYSPGFEVGLGANMNYGDWDVYGNWTRLRNHNTTEHESSFNEFVVVPLAIVGAISPPVASSYKSRWKLNYDTFDFELGRAFVLSRRVTMRPFVGARAVWIHRSIETNYEGLQADYDDFFQSSALFLNGPIKLASRNDYWGLGPRIGLNSRWLLGSTGFGLMANISGSLEAGPFKNWTTARVFGPTTLEGKILEKRVFTTRGNLDALVGFDFGKCFDWVYMYLSLGYDVSFWWNMLNTISFVENDTHRTDLSLRGLDFRVRLDF